MLFRLAARISRTSLRRRRSCREFGGLPTVRRYRKGLGWSQERVAPMARFGRTYIGGVERGERNVSLITIVRLARAMTIPASDLLRDAET